MASEFAEKVAQRIRELRESRGFSLRELARRSGLPAELISRSERALTEITLTSLNRVCAGLGVGLPAFFDFAKQVHPVHRGGQEIKRAVALLADLPLPRRRRVLRALELVVREDTPSSDTLKGRRRRSRGRARRGGHRTQS